MGTNISVHAIVKADKIRAAQEVARICKEAGQEMPSWAADIVFEHGDAPASARGYARVNLCSSDAVDYDGHGDYVIDLEKLAGEWPGCKKLIIGIED